MKLKKVLPILPILLATLVFAGCSTQTSSRPSDAEVVEANTSPTVTTPEVAEGMSAVQETVSDAAMSMPKLIILDEQNDLGQTGTATLTEENGKVKVVLDMNGGNFTTPQPAHIHVGECPNPGVVKYPLTNIVNGKSETLLAVNMKGLMESGETLAINVHKSIPETKVYTACGNLK